MLRLSAYINDDEYEEMLESGEIRSRDELESHWVSYYPEEVNWHKISFRVYDQMVIFGFDTKLLIQLNRQTGQISGLSFEDDDLTGFLYWVLSHVKTEIHTALADMDAYNNYIANNLSLHKRFGKIKRILLWEHVPGIQRFDETLGPTGVRRFETAIKKMNMEHLIPKMTANRFFHYCQICYDANSYFKDSPKLSPRSKYKEMSDGRDEGLTEISGDSEKAFDDWYRNKSHRGGHPWEICRGGNSTHIALMANRQKNGWRLYLAGSSRVRVVETVKMAIAMSEQDIPFILTNAQEILCMIKGSDYCGIVPKDMIPKYCHHYFSDEDKIIDFINPWHDENMYEVINRYATWYPIEKLQRM